MISVTRLVAHNGGYAACNGCDTPLLYEKPHRCTCPNCGTSYCPVNESGPFEVAFRFTIQK